MFLFSRFLNCTNGTKSLNASQINIKQVATNKNAVLNVIKITFEKDTCVNRSGVNATFKILYDF